MIYGSFFMRFRYIDLWLVHFQFTKSHFLAMNTQIQRFFSEKRTPRVFLGLLSRSLFPPPLPFPSSPPADSSLGGCYSPSLSSYFCLTHITRVARASQRVCTSIWVTPCVRIYIGNLIFRTVKEFFVGGVLLCWLPIFTTEVVSVIDLTFFIMDWKWCKLQFIRFYVKMFM